MKKVIIGIGCNVEPRENGVEEAIGWLGTVLVGMTASAVYVTRPEGTARYPYANAVVAGMTDLSKSDLTAMLKDYETAHGRTPRLKALDIVPVDLDLVVYDGDVLRPGDFEALYFTIGYNQIEKER